MESIKHKGIFSGAGQCAVCVYKIYPHMIWLCVSKRQHQSALTEELEGPTGCQVRKPLLGVYFNRPMTRWLSGQTPVT